ncbi:MAG: hypothetical protein CMO44_12910 [Verrucomicrobiales bacterium]|nr:hypothetical protein [Verrucomicrobiales bacterium]|tara:strand:+ start:8502 stop:9140 length:639 start_codon:yes stop_codon:yes gene_type:complete
MSSKIILTSTGIGMALGGLSGGYIGWTIQRQKKSKLPKNSSETATSGHSFPISEQSKDNSRKNTSLSKKTPNYDNRSFVNISSKASLKQSGDLLPVNLKQLRQKQNYELFDDLLFLYKFSLYDNSSFVGICNKVDSLLDLSEYVHNKSIKVTPLQLRKASTYFSNIKQLCEQFAKKITSAEKIQVQERLKSIVEKCEDHFQNTISEVTLRMG